MKKFAWAAGISALLAMAAAAFIVMGKPSVDGMGGASKSEKHKPMLVSVFGGGEVRGEKEGETYDAEEIAAKNAPWTAEQAAEYRAIFESRSALAEKEQQGKKHRGGGTGGAGGYQSLAEGSVTGQWINRGPWNMPGAWNTATIDVGTDTLYGVTCGHYGGGQTIWKGTLAGNDFRMLPASGRMPLRVLDISVFRSGNTKAIIYTAENGPVYVSFDDGQSFTKSTGLPSVMMNTVIDRKNGKIYTTDGQYIYVSSDLGASFSPFLTLGAKQNTRLYTPLFSVQPGYGTLYAQYGTAFKKISGTTATTMGTLNGPISNISFSIGGDTRRFYVSNADPDYSDGTKKQLWWTSTNEGQTWTQKFPTGHYYDGVCEMSGGNYIGVSPLNPDYIVAGYAHPTVSSNGLTTVLDNEPQWGWYQGNQGSVASQQATLVKYYHPDFQSTHFYLDKNGAEFSLWPSDGGFFISRVAHLNGNITDCEKYGFQNIMLQGGTAVTETYEWGMVCGTRNATDFALGTQDQGIQNSQPGLVNNMVQVIQSPGGDGEPCASGPDGEYGWSISGDKVKNPFPLYSGSSFNWSKARGGSERAITVNNVWFDLKDYATTLWVLNSELNKVVWNGSSFTATPKTFGNTGAVAALCQSPSNKSIFWVLDNNKVYKSTDGGANFGTGLTVTMTASNSGNNVRGWAFDDNTIVFAGSAGGGTVTSIVSTDGGASFTAATGLPSTGVRWMQGDKNKKVAMASTPLGPYIFDLAQKKWFDAAGDMNTGAPFFDGKWGAYIPSTNTFRFSTWGYGVWDFVLSTGPTIGITTNPDGGTVYPGNTVSIQWSTTETGTVTVDLMKNGILQSTLGTAASTAGTWLWTVDASLAKGTGYTIQLTLGTLTAESRSFALSPVLLKVPQKFIAVESFDSEQDAAGNAAANSIDGDPSTIWHTSWSTTKTYPHEIVYRLDRIGIDTMLGFSYTPRSDGENGIVKDFDILMSTDAAAWITVKTGTLLGAGGEEIVLFDTPFPGTQPTDPLFVKFVAKSEKNGNDWASMAEFNLYCDRYDTAATSMGNMAIPKTPLAVLGLGHMLRITSSRPGSAHIAIFALNGRAVMDEALDLPAGTTNLSLAGRGLAAGQYLVRLQGVQGKTVSRIVLK